MANWEVEEPPIVSREQWGALPYTSSEPVNHPVNFIRFQYTGLETCTNKKECFKFLQDMQKEHMEKHNLPDIQYNFLVSSEGDIYEGRGWNRCAYREGKHDHVWRNDMINIGYIGYFKLTPLPMKMEAATVELLAWGLQSNYILKGCVSFPHRYGNIDFTPY